jgi:hypothetical protein
VFVDTNPNEESLNEACRALNDEQQRYEKRIKGRTCSGLPKFEEDLEEHIDNWLELGIYFIKKQVGKLKIRARYRLYKSKIYTYLGVKKGTEEYLKLLKKLELALFLKRLKNKAPLMRLNLPAKVKQNDKASVSTKKKSPSTGIKGTSMTRFREKDGNLD